MEILQRIFKRLITQYFRRAISPPEKKHKKMKNLLIFCSAFIFSGILVVAVDFAYSQNGKDIIAIYTQESTGAKIAYKTRDGKIHDVYGNEGVFDRELKDFHPRIKTETVEMPENTPEWQAARNPSLIVYK
jgi:hypothetical protein